MRSLQERLESSEILLLDGGFGSELIRHGVILDNSAFANVQHPEIVTKIHSDYIDAGANIIETNTFQSGPLTLALEQSLDTADYDAITTSAVECTKKAADGRGVYIAGSIGPVPGALEIDGGTVATQEVIDHYRKMCDLLVQEGVDMLAIETIFSKHEAALAIDVAKDYDVPISLSVMMNYYPATEASRGRRARGSRPERYITQWGHDWNAIVSELYESEHASSNLIDHVQILGVNCGPISGEFPEKTGMEYAEKSVIDLTNALESRNIFRSIIAYPNAGNPTGTGKETRYDQSPEFMASKLPSVINAGATIVGGCCGTTAAHIQAFRSTVNSYNA